MLIRIIKKIQNYFFIRKNLNIGENTRVITKIKNFGTEPYLVEIGNNCTITSGVKFITHDASIEVALNYYNKKRIINDKKFESMSKILILDNCMIGVNSIILPGVRIGPNSVVGAGSVVTKDIPEGVVYGGNPAKFICTIEDYMTKIDPNLKLIPITKSLEERKKIITNHMSE